MKRSVFNIFTCVFLFGMPLLALPQSTAAALKEVRMVFDNMNAATTKGKTCYLNYEIWALLNEKDKDGKNIVSNAAMEMLTNDKFSWFRSKQMEVYRDQISTITVLPDRKTIYIGDAVVEKKNEKLYDKMTMLQDTIFKHAKKVTVEEVSGKDYTKVITLYLEEKLSKVMGMKKVIYYIHSAKGILEEVFIEYVPGNEYKTLRYVFKQSSNDYREVNISRPVTQLFFAKKNTLKPEYKSYRLIDNRKETFK